MSLRKSYLLPLLKGNMVVMTAGEIKFLRSDGPVVYITDDQERQWAGGQPLRFYADLLAEEGFFQVSQSMLVNLTKVRYIDATKQQLELSCGKRLPVSRNGLKQLREHIRQCNYIW